MSDWVVVVDDEALSLMNARNLLSAEDMQVSCLRSGKDLMKFVDKNEPDVILLDVMMQGMDGFETLSALREFEKEEGRRRTPVIFLTGDNDSDTVQRGLKAGAADFINKPFDQKILVSRIHKTIANSNVMKSLVEEASQDKLTGFLNKEIGRRRISELCSSKVGALGILNFDNFKMVNNLYGSNMGDRLLKAFADIVRSNTRTGDVISRVGGDEFIGFFSGMTEEAAVASLSARLNDQLIQKAMILMGDDFDIPLGISIGVSFIPEQANEYEIAFKYADEAIYKVKQLGKHGYGIYSLEEDDKQDVSIEAEYKHLVKIYDEYEEDDGALYVGGDSYANIYRYVHKLSKFFDHDANKVLFSLKKDSSVESYVFKDARKIFIDNISKFVGEIDIIVPNRQNEFLILFPNTESREIKDIVERIVTEWKKISDPKFLGIDVEYYIS